MSRVVSVFFSIVFIASASFQANADRGKHNDDHLSNWNEYKKHYYKKHHQSNQGFDFVDEYYRDYTSRKKRPESPVKSKKRPVSSVPEPGMFVLIGLGIAGLVLSRVSGKK